MSQALYRKWRPARFDEVIGQEHVTNTLRNSVAADRVGHAYLFCGPRGTGKTTSARLLAKAVNCLHDDPAERPCNQCTVCIAIKEGRFLDLIEIDAASNTGVDDIRDLRDKINFAPSEGRFKVYIIDEVHMLSTAAFNALLKTLEEPPPHAKFVLATTEEHKVPMTIKSRCQQFNFRLLSTQEIIGRLNLLIEKESLDVEREVLSLVAEHGAGSLRDSESLLDQLVGGPGDTITLKQAQAVLGTASNSAVSSLVSALLDGDGAAGLAVIQEALTTGTDARQFCRQMVSYLRNVLLLQTAGDAISLDMPREQQAEMAALAKRARRLTLLEATKQFNEAANTPATSWQPQLPLELAFIQSLPEEPYQPPIAQAAPQAQPAVVTPPTPATDTSQTQPEPEPTPPPQAQPPSQPRPSASSPEPAQQSAPAATFTIADVKGKVWRQLVAGCRKENKNLSNWLNAAQPIAVESDNVLIIGFALDFLKPKLEAEQETVSDVLSQILGTPARIRCVMTADYTPPAAIPTSAAEAPSSKKNFKQQLEEIAAELGGEVKETTQS